MQLLQAFGYFIVVMAIVYANYITEDRTVYAYIVHIPSILLVGGGLFGFFLANNPIYQLMNIFRCLYKLSSVNLYTRMKQITKIKDLTSDFYQRGHEVFKQHIGKNHFPAMWENAFEKLTAKLDIVDIKELLKFEYKQRSIKINDSIQALRRVSAIAPSLGMFGTILGLIKLLDDLTDYSSIGANMSLALITTLYGILFSIVFIDPLINKLEVYKVVRRRNMDLLLWWLDAIESRKPVTYFANTYLDKKSTKAQR